VAVLPDCTGWVELGPISSQSLHIILHTSYVHSVS
jgi:hypothetical protein